MVLGITGGVGSGKSKVLEYLEKEKGALVLVADDIARDISESEGPALDAIRELFKDDGVLTPLGLMDRPKVAELIFRDECKRRALEEILHSATSDEIKTRINNSKSSAPDRLIVLESAIFFESGCDRFCDAVMFVYADPDVRRMRLREKRGYSDEKIDTVMGAQMSDEDFRARCDYTVDNSGNIKNTIKQVLSVLVGLL